MANGSKIAMPEQSDPEKELRGNSPVPDQDLGNGFSIHDGVLYGIDSSGGSVESTFDLFRKLKDQEYRKKLIFGSWENSEEPKDKTRH
ncbi:hypothetical protein SAMN02745246_01412 [Leeuwenhoekiella marinoflava DSM 3653]|uniref:Uncharacterized protein n=3 Tax=Leeuwenhoekiella marinoflava TaxID=988 RepID=A0A4Q0PPF9_9FLAO|nr:hypothetical protein DSL99_1357 [Leeuwenhoekiella marinoflava]SHE96229.1 hypothetical protein SAMN02745246_01412 [Leeuwenhoekiella marinoflava DSM 3653]